MDFELGKLTFGRLCLRSIFCTGNSLALAKFTITWVTSLPVGESWRRQRQEADRQKQGDSNRQQGNLREKHFWGLSGLYMTKSRHDMFNAVFRTLITRSKGSPGRDACGEPANRLRGPWNIPISISACKRLLFRTACQQVETLAVSIFSHFWTLALPKAAATCENWKYWEGRQFRDWKW